MRPPRWEFHLREQRHMRLMNLKEFTNDNIMPSGTCAVGPISVQPVGEQDPEDSPLRLPGT